MSKSIFITVLFMFFSQGLWARGSAPVLCKSLFSKPSSEKLLKTDIDPNWAAQMSNRNKTEDEKKLMDLVKEYAGRIPGEFKSENHNTNYTNEIPKREVKNQCQAGSCWIFAGTNMLEGYLKTKGKLKNDFSFSQNYLYFFSLLERANVYLESQIINANKLHMAEDIRYSLAMKKPSDGGVPSEFLYLVKKYGLVPNKDMPHTVSSQNSQLIISALNEYLTNKASEMWMHIDHFKGIEFHNERYLVEKGAKQGELPVAVNKLQKAHFEYLRKLKQEVLSGAFKILESHLGTPPTQIEYSGFKKTQNGVYKSLRPEVYTPKEFAENVIDFKADEYVTITDIPTRAKNKTYQTTFPSHLAKAKEGFKFLNTSAHRLIQLIKKTIDRGVPVYFIGDFSKDISAKTGVMHPGLTNKKLMYMFNEIEAPRLGISKKEDRLYHLVASINHAVIIDAYDMPQGSKLPVKFRIENSWGKENGDKGHFHMYLEWFLAHGYGIMVPKEMLTERERKIWEGETEYFNGLMH